MSLRGFESLSSDTNCFRLILYKLFKKLTIKIKKLVRNINKIKGADLILAGFVCSVFFLVAFLSVSGLNWNDLKHNGDALISDELSHIPAGYYYLTTGRYFINNEHPPLVKDLAAIPLLLFGPAMPVMTGDTFKQDNWVEYAYPYPENLMFPKEFEVFNHQWDFGRYFLFNSANDPDLITFWARYSVLFFNSLALFVLYLSLTKVWSLRASLISLFLIAVSQFSLAHASLVTLDFMPTILGITGFVWFSVFITKFSKGENSLAPFLLSVILFSLSMLSKFSFVLVLPIAFISGLIYLGLKARARIWPYIVRFVSLSILIMLFIGVFYSFHVRNMEEEPMMMTAALGYPTHAPQVGLDIIYSLINTGNPFLKGIADYTMGVILVMIRLDEAAQNTYFMGAVHGSEGAGALYFPILYFTKLSLGFLFLLILALVLAVWHLFSQRGGILQRFKKFITNPLSLILLIAIYIYAIITLSSNFQIGLRHIMPIVFASFLLVGKGIDKYWKLAIGKLKLKYLYFTAFLAMILSTAWAFPRYLEYYNYLGGGVDNGYQIATDSNYDWGGQDVKLLGKWVEDNNIPKIYTHIFSNVPLQYYLGEGNEHYEINWGWLPPPGSYVAVSVFEYQNNVYNDKLNENQKYTKIKDDFLTKVGKTMLIYKIH